MRRILSLPGLAVAAWASCLGLLGLLAGMVLGRAWHPHFLPATTMLLLVVVTGLALVVGASWRIIRGQRRRRALSCLLIGWAPLWFLAGFFLHDLAITSRQKIPLTPALELLMPLAESLMDLEARFRYPQRTVGDMVVMISPAMPEADARMLVAAMDRHVRALEARLGRRTGGIIHWARGPLLGTGGNAAIFGLCMGTQLGEAPADAEGLCTVDRHEVAHCVLNSQCPALLDPPAMLTEGWARANQGVDAATLAYRVRADLEDGNALTLRQLTAPDWYDRHEEPAYFQGATLVNFLLRRFGPETFLELYTTCTQSTFESDCRRILGLDLDGLDAAYRAEIERLISQAPPVERLRLERLRLGPGVDATDWKAFLADYFESARRMLAPYHHARLTAVWTGSTTDAGGQRDVSTYEERVVRSGELASLRRQSSGHELALLAHPRRSIAADRPAPREPWLLEDGSRLTPPQLRHRILQRIDELDVAGRRSAALIALADDLPGFRGIDAFAVTALERFTESGRPRVRVRIENHFPASNPLRWRADTYVLAADDLYATQSEHVEGVGPDSKTYQTNFTYDRHEGTPVLSSMQTMDDSPAGSHPTSELEVVERQFGPIAEEDFDPDRFLDGPQIKETQPGLDADEPSLLKRWYWLTFPIGALGLFGGAVLSYGTGRNRDVSSIVEIAPSIPGAPGEAQAVIQK
jgi:hypothetical protein